MQCSLGELYTPCTTRNDAGCVNCTLLFMLSNSNINSNFPEGLLSEGLLEYITPGTCNMRCIAGYYTDPFKANSCLLCSQALECTLGFRPSSLCIDPADRLTRPKCVPCAADMISLASNEIWSATNTACSKRCAYGYVPLVGLPEATALSIIIIMATKNWDLNLTATIAKQILTNGSATGCVFCKTELCDTGSFGACVQKDQFSIELQCTPCSSLQTQPEGTRYITPGDCTLACLNDMMQPLIGSNPATGGCALPPPPLTTPPPSSSSFLASSSATTMGGKARPELQYPSRTMKHSA